MKDQLWIWPGEGNDFYYDKNEWVRIRIESELWHDITPTGPSKRGDTTTSERKSPYSIIASMRESGLGPVVWW